MMRWMRVPCAIAAITLCATVPVMAKDHEAKETPESARTGHVESPRDAYAPPPLAGTSAGTTLRSRGGHVSVQVNTDALGNDIVNDAANEPSIAVDPSDPQRMAIGWRQFDNISSDFRQAGWAYTADGGNTWTFPGSIEPGVFRSDPVLDSDADGNFFYNSLTADGGTSNFRCHVYKSSDGGQTWDSGTYAYGGDKQWQAIDQTNGIGRGNIYAAWNASFSSCSGNFTVSYDDGQSFEPCSSVAGNPYWGTAAVGPDGELYVSGTGLSVAKSTTMQDSSQSAAWDFTRFVDMDGSLESRFGPNPGGLLGQAWVAVDHSSGPTRGNVYMLASVDRSANADPLDVMFARSVDGGLTWSAAVRVNDDPGTTAFQWLGTMSVAPNGRIDAIWLDTRNDPGGYDSELYYSFSIDAGVTWSANEALSPSFDPHLGWPQQNKMGDYFDMVSDDLGANLAYAATFGGEQNVYFIRIGEPACPDAGLLALDRPKYACDTQVGIDLLDCGLNTDDGVVETVQIDIDSDSETGIEQVTLGETAPASARFEGSIPLSESDGPGVLLITEGDTITVTYVDADDGAGGSDVVVTAQAAVECTPPVISNVQALDVESVSATITFDTNEPTRGIVHYGLACGALGATTEGQGYSSSPTIALSGLNENTLYFYSVEAEDEAGNFAMDDNGGVCHAFQTPDVPNYFTEQFTTGVDLDGQKLTFIPNGSVDFYSACVEPIDALPTDPAGGTQFSLSDDSEAQAALTGGKTVSFFGATYSSFQVVSNGYITFAPGETGYDESYEEHFSVRRISALFDDLNPNSGGVISWKQLDDRAVATWQDLPEIGGGSNTFQIELHFDGTITISYLGITCNDAIAGLSEGEGLSAQFIPTDLSETGVCGPRPPIAAPSDLSTPLGVPLILALDAMDDGLPQDPGTLSFSIVSLPSDGYLEDRGAGTISTVPYTLVANGNEVIYLPAPGGTGIDGFEFQAHDGGTPPEGGDSNIATVWVTRGGPQVIQSFDLDTDPGWATTGNWAFGQPTGSGSHNGDPSAGFSGPNVYGYNLDGDYTNGMAQEYLTTPTVDLSEASGTRIEFQRWLGVDSSTNDRAELQMDASGFGFFTVWAHSGGAIDELAWSKQSYDISLAADGRPAVRFRWVMGTTNGSVTYPGWNIDDIRILGNLPQATCVTAPGEVENLRFLADGQTLSWQRPADMGGPVTPVYDVLRSYLPEDFVTADCIEAADGSDAVATDGDPMEGSNLAFYLVRAENGCGAGSIGETSEGATRAGVECPGGP